MKCNYCNRTDTVRKKYVLSKTGDLYDTVYKRLHIFCNACRNELYIQQVHTINLKRYGEARAIARERYEQNDM